MARVWRRRLELIFGFTLGASGLVACGSDSGHSPGENARDAGIDAANPDAAARGGAGSGAGGARNNGGNAGTNGEAGGGGTAVNGAGGTYWPDGGVGGEGTDASAGADAGPTCTGSACQDLCGANRLWTGKACAPCPPCTGEGEVGRYASATLSGECICETKPGYFYSLASQIGTLPCDKDGDGWVRASARVSAQSGDPALVENQRCAVRTVGSITLRNERLQEHTVLLKDKLGNPAPLELYETDRNDDDDLIDFTWSLNGYPGYNQNGSPPRAATLNSFTKLCHDAQMDYNDNGLPDVTETPDAVGDIPDRIRGFAAPFLPWAYYAELHQGQYVAGVFGGAANTYVIAEKSRSLTTPSATRVPQKYDATDGAYWRQCRLARDSEWDAYGPVGMDFARYGVDLKDQLYVQDGQSLCHPATWEGMNMSSLLKCMVVQESRDIKTRTIVQPEDLRAGKVRDQNGKIMHPDGDYRVNTCRSQGTATPVNGNPWLESFSCNEIDPGTVAVGQAYWAAARYIDHNVSYPTSCLEPSSVTPPATPVPMQSPVQSTSLAAAYVRGCMNSCANPDNGCSPIPEPPPSSAKINGCNYQPSDFGKQVGCAEQCDGLDNDRDGTIDNGINGKPCTQVDGSGTPLLGDCHDGKLQCSKLANNTISYTCVGPTPTTEVCDGRDNNCNGIADQDDAVVGEGSNCSNAVSQETGTPLLSTCAAGKLTCTTATGDWVVKGSDGHEVTKGSVTLMCASTSTDATKPEDPCDKIDNDCDGHVDETFSLFEGDSKFSVCASTSFPKTKRCGDARDDNCDGVVGSAPPSSTLDGQQKNGFRVCVCFGAEVDACDTIENCDTVCSQYKAGTWKKGSCAHVPVEICGNGVDDDCDGWIDENVETSANPWFKSDYLLASGKYYLWSGMTPPPTYNANAAWPVGILCRIPCVNSNETRCATDQQAPIYTAENITTLTQGKDPSVLAGINAENIPVDWTMTPPWFGGFQKVLACQGGYWRVSQVCGVDPSALAFPGAGGVSRLPNVPLGVASSATSNKPFCQQTNGSASCTAIEGGGIASSRAWNPGDDFTQVPFTYLVTPAPPPKGTQISSSVCSGP